MSSTRSATPAATSAASAAYAATSVDRYVLDLRSARRAIEPLEVPVDQRPEGEEELALERDYLLLELVRNGAAQRLEDRDQRGHGVRDRRAWTRPRRAVGGARPLLPAGRRARGRIGVRRCRLPVLGHLIARSARSARPPRSAR